MAVDREGGVHAGVAEPFADGLDILTCARQERGVRVPDVVKADATNVRATGWPVEPMSQRI
jgi:hypothetical protein